MNLYTYDFEVQTMSNMFINAFSDITVKRLNVHKQPRDEIKTRVVYAPKQRVLNDLLNKDQNLQLPVVSVSIGSVARDESRVSNKILGTYHISSLTNNKSTLEKTPIPIDITYNVSIMTRYQQDMDQILSHILPYVNPYFVISWRTPSRPDFEIRSNVYWDGNVNVQYPTEVNSSQLARVVADLSFTFKGWIFQRAEEVSNIYTFDTTMISVPDINRPLDTSYKELSASVDRTIYTVVPPKPRFIAPDRVRFNTTQQFETWGSGYETITNVYLSGGPLYHVSTLCNPFSSFTELSAANPPFFGYKLNRGTEWSSDNVSYMTFVMPSASINGRLDLIVENIRGYGKLTEHVRRDDSNPFPESHPMHDSFVSYQVPYLNGIEVYGINHPYPFGAFWTDYQLVTLGDTLYTSLSTESVAFNISAVEINGYSVTTNNIGVIVNYFQIIHTNSLSLSGVTYYHDGILSNGITRLYPLSTTNMFIAGLSGVWDIEGDSFDDNFGINNRGIIFWRAIDYHDYQHGLYWSNDQTLTIGSVLYTAQISRTTVQITNQMINGYEVSTNENGIITRYAFIHINNIVLGGVTYYFDDQELTNGSTVLYEARDTNVVAANENGGEIDLDEDGNEDNWTTDLNGIISWSMHVSQPYSHFGSYYSADNLLVKGASILYNAQGTGATLAVNLSGQGIDLDADSNLDIWSTNANGVVNWTMQIVHPYSSLNNYFYHNDSSLINGSTVIWNGAGTAATILNDFGVDDLDGDGNLDEWTIDGDGKINWTLHLYYPNSINLGANTYYYTNTLANSSTILYNTQGSAATIAANLTGYEYFDGEGNVFWRTNSSGVFGWEVVNHPNSVQLGSSTYYYGGDLVSGETIMFSGTNSYIPVSNIQGTKDINEDTVMDYWYITNGVVSWTIMQAHPYEHVFGGTTYYADVEELHNGVSLLYKNSGLDAELADDAIGTKDVDGDNITDYWNISNGVISWTV